MANEFKHKDPGSELTQGALIFSTAVYVDIPGSNITITVGHS